MIRPNVSVLRIGTYSGHTDCVYSLCKGKVFDEFFTAGGDGMVVKWNTQIPDQGVLVAKLPNAVYAMTAIDEHNSLVVCENQVGLRDLDLSNNKELRNLPMPGLTFFDVKYLNGIILASAHNGKVYVIDYDVFELVKIIDASSKSARSIALCEKRNEFAVAYSDYNIRIFDTLDFELKKEIVGHSNSVFSVVYDEAGDYLISAGRDAHLKNWDVKTDYALVQSVPAHLFAINNIAFRNDYRYFATCSMDKAIKIWDAYTFTLLKVIDKSRNASHGTSVNKLLWQGDTLVSVSDDRKVALWSIEIS
jgi:WD40 repeat protein